MTSTFDLGLHLDTFLYKVHVFLLKSVEKLLFDVFWDPNRMHLNVLGLGEYSYPDLRGGFFKHYTCQESMSQQQSKGILSIAYSASYNRLSAGILFRSKL